jgi:magnesium transporter
MITAHAYDRASRAVHTLTAADLASRRDELLAGQDVLWIDLSQPTPEEEHLVFQTFYPIHTLSLEDITRLRREPDAPPHLPKVEEFPDYLFVIVNPLTASYLRGLDESGEHLTLTPRRSPDQPSLTQLSAILTERILITHHYEPSRCTGQLEGYLRRHSGPFDRGPDYLFHLVLDNTVDEYAPVLDYIDDALEHLETAVLQRPRPPLFQKMLRLKREIIVLRKTLIHEREVLVRLARGEFQLVDERETAYYRNVYDHLVRFTELIESSRDMAGDLLQSYLASTSNRLNEIMKVLTMISTIVLPMTLVAGIYGMNFKHMPEIDEPWGYPFALGLMALSAVVSLGFFYWRKWL